MEKVIYSDGNNYSHLESNIHDRHDEYEECVWCGDDQNVTITDEADICHECGYVYR